MSIDSIPQEVLVDCSQLVKANSIEGQSVTRTHAHACPHTIFPSLSRVLLYYSASFKLLLYIYTYMGRGGRVYRCESSVSISQ